MGGHRDGEGATADRSDRHAIARGVALALALGCAALALAQPGASKAEGDSWWLIVVAVALTAAAFRGVPANGTAIDGAGPPRGGRGRAFIVAGAGVWIAGAYALQADWPAHFDRAWIAWLAAAALTSVGLDRWWGRWGAPRPRGSRRAGLALAVVVLAAAAYRLGSLLLFPAESHIVKIEELQNGAIGATYLQGWRLRWEFIGHTWLAALGLWLGGPSLLSMRLPFTIVSALKAVPLFLWLRFSVGTSGAIVGALLLACSQWDVILARMPSNPNALVIAAVFALLAGPARRGRPSAYVWLGVLGGWVLYEYVAYRPLALVALAGASWVSLRDRSLAWAWRLFRPLVTATIIVIMALPLGLFLHQKGRGKEYFDGWNRARAVTAYYGPDDGPAELATKAAARAVDTAAMFLFRGVKSPALNPTSHPLLDSVTALLVVVGVGWSLAHLTTPVFGLTVVALGGALFGGMIAAGNFDPARASPTVPYVFALAGYGAGGLGAAVAAAWGRRGRRAAAAALILLVLAAAHLNGRYLIGLLTSPEIQQVQLHPLIHLTNWLRGNVRPGERVVAVAPGFAHVLGTHDAAWLRGEPMDGLVAWDIESALRDWAEHPQPTVLFVYAGTRTAAIMRYLDGWLSDVSLELVPDPSGGNKGDIAFAHVAAPPSDLARRLAEPGCRGAQAEFELVGAGKHSLGYARTVVPFIDQATWPDGVRQQVQANPKPESVHAKFQALFTVARPGGYRFTVEPRAGSALLSIDGTAVTPSNPPLQLGAGEHRLEIKAAFKPIANEMMVRLMWQGPDSGDILQLMPLYSVARPSVDCREPPG